MTRARATFPPRFSARPRRPARPPRPPARSGMIRAAGARQNLASRLMRPGKSGPGARHFRPPAPALGNSTGGPGPEEDRPPGGMSTRRGHGPRPPGGAPARPRRTRNGPEAVTGKHYTRTGQNRHGAEKQPEPEQAPNIITGPGRSPAPAAIVTARSATGAAKAPRTPGGKTSHRRTAGHDPTETPPGS